MAKRWLCAAVGAAILIVGGLVWYWNRPTPTTEPGDLNAYREATRHASLPDGCEKVEYLDQGWWPRDSADFYTRTQGSRLLPYRWFLSLERADSETPFRDPGHLRRLGYLPQEPNPLNPDGLPVGFARDPDRGGDWLGFTCAACHTGEVHYEKVAYRIDGGPGFGDLQAFLAELTAALAATRDDPAKFERFRRALDRPADELREQLGEVVRVREAYEATNRTPHPYGPARLDAFGRIVNDVLTTAVGVADPAQAKPPDAPVSYPYLWDTPHHDYVQWNGVARNRIAGSSRLGGLVRNVGQVLGVFGTVSVSAPGTASTLTGYDSSARVTDLVHLEEFLHGLRSPRWPAGFPAIDEGKRAAGEKLYAKYCSHCHAGIDRADPDRSVAATRTPLADIGTDPRMATNFATRSGKTGKLEGRRLYFSTGDRFGPTAPAAAMVVHVVVGTVLGSPWKDAGLDLSKLSEVRDRPTNDPGPMVYKARPLNGVWATAPYLHNGSVPTLYHLLLPAAERPKSFRVGSRRFDPANVGFETDVGPAEFRTDVPGNANIGHEYGTGRDGLPPLTDAERRELVEYLKSL